MTFYISTRPIRINKVMVTPKEHLKNNFSGLDFSYKLIAWNKDIDGRMLYEITLSDIYTTEEKNELKTMLVESLSIFGGHLKTLSSAQALAIKITNLTVNIVGEKIEVVYPAREAL